MSYLYSKLPETGVSTSHWHGGAMEAVRPRAHDKGPREQPGSCLIELARTCLPRPATVGRERTGTEYTRQISLVAGALGTLSQWLTGCA